MTRSSLLLTLFLLCGTAAADGLTLSPAVVPLGGSPGQSTQQTLTLFNDTPLELRFQLVAKDVVVRDGKRVFVDAGERAGSIAATAVFSTSAVTVRPHEQRSVDVTVTLPAKVTGRAVVILFQGTTRVGAHSTISLGTLLTFELKGTSSVAPGELRATAPTASADAAFTLPVVNDGSEPTVTRGVVAIIDGKGGMIGKVAIDPHRLLPGERTSVRVEYPGTLPRGTYRVIATIESAKRSWTRLAGLEVK